MCKSCSIRRFQKTLRMFPSKESKGSQEIFQRQTWGLHPSRGNSVSVRGTSRGNTYHTTLRLDPQIGRARTSRGEQLRLARECACAADRLSKLIQPGRTVWYKLWVKSQGFLGKNLKDPQRFSKGKSEILRLDPKFGILPVNPYRHSCAASPLTGDINQTSFSCEWFVWMPSQLLIYF